MSRTAAVVVSEDERHYTIYVSYGEKGEAPAAEIVAVFRKDKYSEKTIAKIVEKIKTIFKAHFGAEE